MSKEKTIKMKDLVEFIIFCVLIASVIMFLVSIIQGDLEGFVMATFSTLIFLCAFGFWNYGIKKL